MEKVRFEAFNVEELRVLRRACYEAGAAFGDPGHTAAERATLDDLAVEILGELKKKEAAAAQQKQEEPVEKAAEDSEKGAADQPPVAPKAFQKPEPQKKRAVQRLDILERAKAAQPAESPQGPEIRRKERTHNEQHRQPPAPGGQSLPQMRFRWLHEHYHWQRRQPKDLPGLHDLAAVVF